MANPSGRYVLVHYSVFLMLFAAFVSNSINGSPAVPRGVSKSPLTVPNQRRPIGNGVDLPALPAEPEAASHQQRATRRSLVTRVATISPHD